MFRVTQRRRRASAASRRSRPRSPSRRQTGTHAVHRRSRIRATQCSRLDAAQHASATPVVARQSPWPTRRAASAGRHAGPRDRDELSADPTDRPADRAATSPSRRISSSFSLDAIGQPTRRRRRPADRSAPASRAACRCCSAISSATGRSVAAIQANGTVKDIGGAAAVPEPEEPLELRARRLQHIPYLTGYRELRRTSEGGFFQQDLYPAAHLHRSGGVQHGVSLLDRRDAIEFGAVRHAARLQHADPAADHRPGRRSDRTSRSSTIPTSRAADVLRPGERRARRRQLVLGVHEPDSGIALSVRGHADGRHAELHHRARRLPQRTSSCGRSRSRSAACTTAATARAPRTRRRSTRSSSAKRADARLQRRLVRQAECGAQPAERSNLPRVRPLLGSKLAVASSRSASRCSACRSTGCSTSLPAADRVAVRRRRRGVDGAARVPRFGDDRADDRPKQPHAGRAAPASRRASTSSATRSSRPTARIRSSARRRTGCGDSSWRRAGERGGAVGYWL